MFKAIFGLMLLALLSSGCPKADPKLYEQLETARRTAKANGVYNAQVFKAAHGLLEYEIYAESDSSITTKCPQGDGWVSVTLLLKSDAAVDVRLGTGHDQGGSIALKCSSHSASIGCFPLEDFKHKAYAQEDGKCADTGAVPFPLPLLNQQLRR